MSSPSRRTVLRLLPLFPLAGLFAAAEAHATHYEARLCNSCGFGSKKDNCVRCGKWVGSHRIPARLCSNHGFGSKKDNCVRCGKWVGSFRQLAYLCGNCGFGSKKDNCAICGKWAP
ncbi:MAG TPA: hypothetical protein PKI03_12340 [Pseudomonadota bacterium]|nr:hypothetical protein [Pseudomonadota bacterium]